MVFDLKVNTERLQSSETKLSSYVCKILFQKVITSIYLYNCKHPIAIKQIMEITFHNAIELLAAFQAFLFALYLISANTGKRAGNYFISFFLVLMGLNLAHNYIEYYLDPLSVNAYVFVQMTIYLAAPALYLYIKSTIAPDFKISWKTALHLIPWVLFNLLIIKNVYLENLKGDNAIKLEIHSTINNILFISFYIQNWTYLIISFIFLKRFKKLYYEGFSNTDTRKYNYLFRLNSLVLLVFILSALKNFILYNFEGDFLYYASQVVLLLILILFCWIIFKGLQSPELFRSSEEILPPVKDLIKLQDKNIKEDNTGIEAKSMDKETNEMVNKVKAFMAEEEPFLDASLSLHDLARQTKIPSRELSLLINHHLNQHFFDFVNEYRIEKAMHILRDADKKDLTVLEILYEVGFNSKSSFNTAFKKHTGYTPTEYRKRSSLSAA